MKRIFLAIILSLCGALLVLFPSARDMVLIEASSGAPLIISVPVTTISDEVNISGYYVAAIKMPDAWNTANLTFQASADCSNYGNVYDIYGSLYTVNAAAGRYISVNPADFSGARCIKIRSGTPTVTVTQSAGTILQIAFRDI